MTLNKGCTVGFVGTGIMGAPIAGHLLDAGYKLRVHNRTPEKADELLARGATWAETPADAACGADVVFTMLGYPTDVENAYLATDGLLRAARRGTWLIDLTTSSPQLARDIHDAAETFDLHAFDCPVTGGDAGAREGTLTLIAGMGGSVQLSRVAAKALEGDYAPGFLAEHLRKDLGIALEQSEDLELTMPETEQAYNLVDLLCRAGGSRLGTQALALLYADEATSTAAGLDWSLVAADEDGGPSPARQRYFMGTSQL